MLRLIFLLPLVIWPFTAFGADPPPRPNILWITSEDNAAHWIGCYGNAEAQTPHIDRLAARGVRFTHAYSNGAVCAVARSTLLTGVHAVTQGTQQMRSRYPLPSRFRPYVSYLRNAGYYCTNNSKTDYNFAGDDRAWWDESSGTAHYKHRPEGAPFFAIFNITVSHESSLFDDKTAPYLSGERTPRIAPEAVSVPPYLPDLPEVRRDIAIYHETITRMDRRVGRILAELEQAGLAESTIVFYFSDHGGILPRGKRYLHDTGTRVPLVIHVPPAFADRFSFAPGTTRDEVVEFIDLAPTLLHLAGVEIPEQMRGRPLLEAGESESAGRVAFLYADRFDETYRHQRAITDGRLRYIHNFAPHLPAALQNEYPYGIASWRAWRRASEENALSPPHRFFFNTPQPASELFHTGRDTWEVKNVAGSPTIRTLVEMRSRLRQEMLDHHDLGVIPEPFWPELAPKGSIYDYAHRGDFPWAEVVDASFRASMATENDLSYLIELMEGEHPVLRYWGALGCLGLGDRAAESLPTLERLATDPHAANRITSLHILYRIDARVEAIEGLVREATTTSSDPAATLALHTLYQLGAHATIPPVELDRLEKANEMPYAARWAKRFREN